MKTTNDFLKSILDNDKEIDYSTAAKQARAEYKKYTKDAVDEFWAINETSEFFGKMYDREELENALGKMGAKDQVLVSL